MLKKNILITNDVETTSLLNHKLCDKAGELVLKEGMPRLLELYDKYDVKATFFFTGYIAKLFPEVVNMVVPYGHEVGSHGLTHEVNEAFDVLSFDKQVYHLRRSKEILEDICGKEVISFRAPAARVDYNTGKALAKAGYKIDSSVSSQRLDMFFSFGSLKKMNWITAPRNAYFTEDKNIFKKGNSQILEIPISAFGFPYIGTFMRIFPTINKMTRNILYLENKINHKPIVFLTHPNEFIDEVKNGEINIKKRGSNILSSFFGDVIRHNLKLKNLGVKGIPLLEQELMFFKNKSCEFKTCKQYHDDFKSKSN